MKNYGSWITAASLAACLCLPTAALADGAGEARRCAPGRGDPFFDHDAVLRRVPEQRDDRPVLHRQPRLVHAIGDAGAGSAVRFNPFV